MMHETSRRKFVELHYRWFLAVLLSAAIVCRIGVRMAFGEAGFWVNGYRLYYSLAENVVSGHGFYLGTQCAWLPPLYPLFLALTAIGGRHYLLLVTLQAMMGAGTAFGAFWIGRHMFNTLTGILACAITAFYPYYVMHDTALQDTAMVKLWTILSVCLLFRAGRLRRRRDWFLAGVALGLIGLTRAAIAPTAGVALLWTAVWGTQGNFRDRLLQTSYVLVAFLLTVSPWLIRTYRLTGVPMLSSQTGWALWMGNNPETFSAYPSGSIDVSTANAYNALPAADRAEVENLANDEPGASNWYAHRALTFIRAHPWLTLQRAFYKVEAGFSWRMNPVRESLAQIAYAVTYIPVAVLGLIGMFRAPRSRELMLIAMLYLGFLAMTSVFWAHTSHRSYLDVYWIVLAASVVTRTGRASP